MKIVPVVEIEEQVVATTVMPCAIRNCGAVCLTVEDNDHERMIVERGIPMKRRIAGKTSANEGDGPQRKKRSLEEDAKAAEV